MDENTMNKQLAIPENYGKNMTPAMVQKVSALKAKIDVHDKDKVLAYGYEEQASIGNFYDSVIQGKGTKEMGEAGEILTKAIGDIQGYRVDCNKKEKGIMALLTKGKTKIKNMQTRYQSLSTNMDTVIKELQEKNTDLLQVSRNFDAMYTANKERYEFLTMLIYAGEQAIEEEKRKFEMKKKNAEASGDPMELQNVADYADDIERFEKRIYDLKLSRTIAIQQGPQIKNIQKGADQISESIKTAIFTSIPLWKSQMAIALGMETLKKGLNAVNAVNDATNAMLLANSQMNKELTLEVAKASQRGIVDMETVDKLNQDLIDTFSGVSNIIAEGRTKRAEGAQHLKDSEEELKKAMMNSTKYVNTTAE